MVYFPPEHKNLQNPVADIPVTPFPAQAKLFLEVQLRQMPLTTRRRDSLGRGRDRRGPQCRRWQRPGEVSRLSPGTAHQQHAADRGHPRPTANLRAPDQPARPLRDPRSWAP
jgi:hypothetical protein